MSQDEADLPFVKRSDNRSNKKLWILLVASVLGCIAFQYGYQRAFPAAALDLNISRSRIQKMARAWAEKVGYGGTAKPAEIIDEKPEIITTTFSERSDDKAFLEQQFGQEEANKLMGRGLPIWLWKTRFCREKKFEQCFVWLTPAGQFNTFMHEYRNDFPLTTLTRDDAEKLARIFLRDVAHVSDLESSSHFVLIRDETTAQINREDHVFVWEDRSTDFKGARLDIEVHVSGNKVTYMDRFLHIPQDWQRKYKTMRSYNEQLYNVALFFWFALAAVAVFVFIFATTHHQIRWRFALIAAGFFAMVMFADSINTISVAVSNYSTQIEFQNFVYQYWLSSITAACTWFVAAVIFVGAAEFMYRRHYPKRISVENWFTVKGLSGSEVFWSLVTGHLSSGIYLGWIVIYYLLGREIGFWTPLQVQNASVYSSAIPAVGALHVGVLPAGHEEIVYRVIALISFSVLLSKITLLQKRKTLVFWLANFLQAACWSFMHSTYPQQPAYARGLELIFNGLLFGWLVENFGLLSCLVGHYVLDVFLVMRPILSSGQIVWVAPAVLVCIPFVILLLFSLVRRFKSVKVDVISDDELLSNYKVSESLLPLSNVDSETYSTFKYGKLTPGARLLLAIFAVSSIAGAVFLRSTRTVGDLSKMRIGREQAIVAAQKSLQERFIDASKYIVTVQAMNNLAPLVMKYQMQYLYEYAGLASAIQCAQLADFGYVWNVRFFKPGNPREFISHIEGHGREIGFDYLDIETAKGAQLSPAAAKNLGLQYLTTHHAQFLPITLASSSKFQKENRIDYQFSFTNPALNVERAPFKINLDLVGDHVSGPTSGWLVPDRWKDERDEKTFKDQLSALSKILCPLIAWSAAAFWAVGLLRTGVLRWKLAIIFGISAGILSFIALTNTWPSFFQSMPTTIGMQRYFLEQMSIWLRLCGTEAAKATILAVFALAVFRITTPGVDFLSIIKLTFYPQKTIEDKEEQKQIWVDAVLIAFWFSSLRWLIAVSAYAVTMVVSPTVADANLGAIAGLFNCQIPGVNLLIECLTRGGVEVVSAALMTGLYLQYTKKFPFFLFVFFVGSLLYCLDMPYLNVVDYCIAVIRMLCLGLSTWVFIAKLAKRNLLAYFFTGMFVAISQKLPLILDHAPSVLLGDVVVAFLVLSLPIVAVIYLYLSGRTARQSQTE